MKRFSEQEELLKGPRSRARRKRLWVALISWGIVLVILGGAGYALVVTDALLVQSVRVEGVRLADQERVKAALVSAAETSVLRAWVGPDLLFFWLFFEPPASFLAAYPMFREADVVPYPFTREIVIRVTERALYGVWCLAGGACYAFDEEGTVFGPAPSLEGSLITKVTDVRSAPFVAGETVLPDPEWRARMFETLGALTRLHLTVRAVRVQDLALREWEVGLAEGPLLKFSFVFVPQGLEETLSLLARRPDFHGLTYLDFRVRDRLYYK
ncbi:MAG: hypothetical protein Q8P88_03015 [Candidatus Jorgensenbacteria bacterium]|nr:hypothetical protein [Candidatus Jorgensenbacteria bacterium]